MPRISKPKTTVVPELNLVFKQLQIDRQHNQYFTPTIGGSGKFEYVVDKAVVTALTVGNSLEDYVRIVTPLKNCYIKNEPYLRKVVAIDLLYRHVGSWDLQYKPSFNPLSTRAIAFANAINTNDKEYFFKGEQYNSVAIHCHKRSNIVYSMLRYKTETPANLFNHYFNFYLTSLDLIDNWICYLYVNKIDITYNVEFRRNFIRFFYLYLWNNKEVQNLILNNKDGEYIYNNLLILTHQLFLRKTITFTRGNGGTKKYVINL